VAERNHWSYDLTDSWKESRRHLTEILAPWMFVFSLLYLAILAAIVVVVIDVPRVNETIVLDEDFAKLVTEDRIALERELAYEAQSQQFGPVLVVALLVVWTVFWGELIKDYWVRDRNRAFLDQHRYAWLFCLFPPLRLCRHDGEYGDRVWLPSWGWQTVDYHLRNRLEQAFGGPMALIAILILPVLVLQLFYAKSVADYPWLRIALHVSAGLIWFCFAVEFIIMVSVAQSKLKYCKQHWIELLIIALPLVSFLRTLRILRATKLLRAAQMQHLARLSRVYRLRGLSMRFFRAILLLGFVNRLIPVKRETRLARLRVELAEKEHELAELRRQIALLESSGNQALDAGRDSDSPSGFKPSQGTELETKRA
jgi:voltage-gated potassium channel